MTRSFAILICLLLWIPGVWAETNEIKIGVLAKRGYEKSHLRWDATADYLTASLPKYRFKIVPMTFDDIPVIVKNHLVDFVIVNSGIYVDLAVTYGARRILTLINELSTDYRASQFGSVIFTLQMNAEIRELEDLRNQRIAAVHPTSLGGWIMAQRELHSAGLDRWDFASLRFLNTHDAVVNAVQDREAEAGIVRTDTLERMAQEGQLKLQDFHIISAKKFDHFPYAISTPLYPEWPFALLPHTPLQLAREVSIALLRLPPNHPATRNAHIYGWTIPENYQTVDDLLRLLELPPYERKLPERLLASLIQYWYWYLTYGLALLFVILLSIRVIRLNRSLSEHKMTLESSQEAQVATFEQAAVGLAHITLAGEFLRMNQRLCDIVSLSRKQLKELNLKELLHGDDLPTCITVFDQLRQKKINSTSIQLRIICAGGDTKWIQLSLSVKSDTQGQVEYLVALIDDIDKYKKLEEQNRLVQQHKELILDIAGDGIIGLDDQARYVFVNPAAAELLGYSIEEMLGQKSHDIWHHSQVDGSSYPKDECPITKILKQGVELRSTRETVWRKNGTPLEVEYIGTPIKKDDKVTGAVIVLHPSITNPPSPSSPHSVS
jgi:PAS domain S-box-containing protein